MAPRATRKENEKVWIKGSKTRGLKYSSVLIAALVGAGTAPALAENFNVPDGSLDAALTRFGAQSGLQVIYSTSLTRGLSTGGVRGDLRPHEALDRILAGTGLQYRATGEGSLTLEKASEQVTVAEDGSILLGTIVISGYGFREEVASAPGSVAVLDSQTIDEANLKELTELNARVPGVTLVSSMTGGPQYAYIRGIGKFSEIYGRGLAVNVDGVPQNLVELQNPGISGQIERIEVLKGPQHILYGHNGLAGAINIYTIQPEETGGSLRLGFGSDGYATTSLSYNKVFNDQFSLGGTVSLDRHDGWIDNVYSGSDAAGKNRKDFSLVGVWKPTSDMTVTARAFGYNLTEGGPLLVTINPKTMRPWSAYSSHFPLDGRELNFGQISHDTKTETSARVRGASIDVRQWFGGVEFQSLTGWKHYTDDGAIDVDGGDSPLLKLEMVIGQKNYLLSQNFRFSYDQGGPLKWLAGVDAYYNRYDSTRMFKGGPVDYGTTQRHQGGGIYGQLTWAPNDQLELSFGGRYQIDNTEGIGKGTFAGTSLAVTDKTLLLAGSATWHFSDKALAYASVAESYYPTGIYAIDALNSYEKETGVTAEVGFKARWFDDRLYTAIALYEGRSKNPVYTLATPYSVWSIDEQRNRGVELEVGWQATDNLEIGASWSRSNPEITKWADHPELIGKKPMQVPLAQANINLTYIHDFSFGTLRSRLDVNHMGSHYGDNANTFKTDSYTTVDLSAALEWDDKSLTFWGKNILDEEYYSLIAWSAANQAQASYGRGRSFGLNYQVKF